MTSDLWTSLPAAVREKVDELVVQGRSVQAVFAVRSSGVTPRPGLRACQDVIAERSVVLAGRVAPPPPRDVETLAAEVAALPGPVAAIEAHWDGDTRGWFVRLLAVMADPAQVHELAHVRHGGDLRVFNGQLLPWPEREEVVATGQALAERFGVPFRFDERGGPDQVDEADRPVPPA